MKMKPKCSMLIDQNKYCDNGQGGWDPVGHTCFNDAVVSDEQYFYCKECYEKILDGNDQNITKPNFNCVDTWNAFIDQIKNKEII